MNENRQPLLPAYLVTGPDQLKRETVVRRLRARVAQLGDLEFNSDEFSGESASGEAIVAACNTVPFASEVRLVLVQDADKLKKADRDELSSYLASPCQTTVLCMTATSVPKNTVLYKNTAKLGKQAVIECAAPKRSELPALIRSMATSHGVAITPAAANALLDRIGENTVALDAQLEKLALAHVGTDPIGESEVALLVERVAQVKPWEFVDAFSQRNAQKCLQLRPHVDATPYALMAMCVTRVRELVMARALLDRGQIGALPQLLHLPVWRCKNHGMWARSFTAEELRRALRSARDTELKMKTSSAEDPDALFETWYLAVVTR